MREIINSLRKPPGADPDQPPTHESYSSLEEMASFVAGILDLMGRAGDRVALETLKRTGRFDKLHEVPSLGKADAHFFMPAPPYKGHKVILYSKLAREPFWYEDSITIQGYHRSKGLMSLPEGAVKIRTSANVPIPINHKTIKVSDDIDDITKLMQVVDEATDIDTNIATDFDELLGSLTTGLNTRLANILGISYAAQDRPPILYLQGDSRGQAASIQAHSRFLTEFWPRVQEARHLQ